MWPTHKFWGDVHCPCPYITIVKAYFHCGCAALRFAAIVREFIALVFLYLLSFTIARYRGLSLTIAAQRSEAQRSRSGNTL